MEKVAIDDIDRSTARPARRRLTDALGTTDVAINHYDLQPGDDIGGGYHAHFDQEEVFYVESGRVTFETEAGDVTVAGGEVVRFAPGDFQYGYNASDGPAAVLALGAPPDSEDVESVRQCTECEAVVHHQRPSLMGTVTDPDEYTVECPECGADTYRIGRPD